MVAPLVWHYYGPNEAGQQNSTDPNVRLVREHEEILQIDIEDVRAPLLPLFS